MAGFDSTKDLWQFITGSSILRPKELIADALKRNKTKLSEILSFYKVPSSPSGEILKTERKLQGLQLEFVKKLSKFLALDEVATHDLYRCFLMKDYRGSIKELQDVLGSERHSQAMLLKIRDFYYNERLYLIRSLKHIFSYYSFEEHPYAEEYAAYVKPLYENDTFIKKVKKQYESVCAEHAPTWETRGNAMNDRQISVWMIQNLREQCELLELLVLYYKNIEHSAESIMSFLTLFKKQGFGHRQVNKHILDETMESLIQRIGLLHVILILEGMDLEYLEEKAEAEDVLNHHIISSPTFKELDILFNCLGDCIQHGPLLLTWAALRQAANIDLNVSVRKMGHRALELKVFQYLAASLQKEPFNGKEIVASACHTVVYGMLHFLLAAFHEDSLGDSEGLYDVAAILLSQSYLANEFWDRGLNGGIGTLLLSAGTRFPLDFSPLLQLCAALGKANSESAKKIVQMLKRLQRYTEYMDRSTEVDGTDDQTRWKLARDRRPYPHSKLVIHKGTVGQLHPQPGNTSIIQWEEEFDGWNVFIGQIHALLQQILHGAGTVSPNDIQKVILICKVTQALLAADSSYVLQNVPQTPQLVDLLYQIIHRFCLMSPPPLELLASCIETLTCIATKNAPEVWHKLQQTGLLPYLTENIDNFAEASNGSGLNAGAYGRILAGSECTMGRYPVTIALLNLVSKLVQPMNTAGGLDGLMAFAMFISREIFPVFHKWRYYHFNSKESIGQKSLEIFHNILNILSVEANAKNQSHKVSLRDVCVYNLLYTECGRALLDIIGTGVDAVEAALASQGSAVEGAGVELIQLIRLAFSVLNRLLLLRPPDAPPSPVEHSLSAQPANRAHRHVVAVIAQYIYHRHDPRLPSLATVLLKRLAMVFPMFILTCLGNEAEAIRDIYLSRLQANTEDVRLKVVILELLATCVDTQPGLTEMFLNVQAPGKNGDSKELSVGKTSCLSTVLSLIEESKQGTYQCPAELLCAALEFLHALWNGRRETATSALRNKNGFWHSICLSLTRDLQQPTEEDVEMEVLCKEAKTCANIMKILALELYSVQGAALDKNLKIVLKDLSEKKRIEYWSGYLCENLGWASEREHDPEQALSEDSTLYLLLAWRNLTVVLTTVKSTVFLLTKESKAKILDDLLKGLLCQFHTSKMSMLNVKLASVSSALFFTVLKHWISDLTAWNSILSQLETILTQTCANSETLIPSVQIGLLGALTLIVQQVRANKLKGVESSILISLVNVVSDMLQQSTYQLPAPLPLSNSSGSEVKVNPEVSSASPNVTEEEQKLSLAVADQEIKLKLQTTSVCLLEELIMTLGGPELWLPLLKQHSVVQCLLASIPSWIQAGQGITYIHSVVLFFLSLSSSREGAEMLAVNGLVSQLCLVITALYSERDWATLQNKPKSQTKNGGSKESGQSSLEWTDIFPLCVSLMSAMLKTLKYNFLEDAFNFSGVHQQRMNQCLDHVGVLLSPSVTSEALETCRFIACISCYPREWRLNQLPVLHKLMTGIYIVTQRCASMLVRPRLLQHILEKRSQEGVNLSKDGVPFGPIARRLSQQSSADESESSTQEVVLIQQRLLEILAQCLLALKQFSPGLCEILLDQSMDISEYEPFLKIGFSTPAADRDSEPTFGTMVSCINICLRLLTKMDPKSSPVKAAEPESFTIKKSLVLFVMENSLQLLMSQAVRYLKEPSMSPRDKQLLKRELSAELNSFQQSLLRHYKRGSTSPAASPQAGSKKTLSESTLNTQEHSFFKLVDVFVRQILR